MYSPNVKTSLTSRFSVAFRLSPSTLIALTESALSSIAEEVVNIPLEMSFSAMEQPMKTYPFYLDLGKGGSWQYFGNRLCLLFIDRIRWIY